MLKQEAREPITPEPNEECTILRRRSSMTLAMVAKKLKRSKYWVNLMELGTVPCEELSTYWSSKRS